jgi:serine/threonine protein kinase/tetratricopeptide (TPR) repeat protein
MNPIPLGPFELHAPIGQGGMGEVWRGVHRGQGTPVAVKVLLDRLRGDGRFLEAFRNEVRQVARLWHPGVVVVFDQGVVTTEAESASEGALFAGSPWLAMEYVGGGSLDRLGRYLSWAEVRSTLLAVLGALGHAHARGVLHRDVKPANVLVAGASDLRPGLRLTDFGLSHAWYDPTDRPLEAGTADYMSPEQIRGEWRDQGPWTDLYAVGCMAYELATGRVPFSGTRSQIIQDQLYAPPPAFDADFAAPAGFEGWVRRSMAKAPHRRFRSAAEAAHALNALGEMEERLGNGASSHRSRKSDTWVGIEDLPEGPEPRTEELPPILRAPLPETWRRPEPPPSPRLVGAGLGLYGLRTVPFVNRDVPRDALWAALRGVEATRRPAVAVLSGPAGIGKTRLATWIAERAQEAAGATVLWATHGPLPTPSHGLPRMIARHLRCIGLPLDRLRARMSRLQDEPEIGGSYEAESLARLAAPGAGVDVDLDAVAFPSAEERFRLLVRYLERLGAERPVLLVLEDVLWGADTLAFVRHLLDAEGSLPVLALLTARDDALASRPLEAESLASLALNSKVTSKRIEPLAAADQAALVRDLLLLDDALAREVERRSAGNPLFAVELVGDWVRRGVLRVDERGFALVEGEAAVLPDDIHDLWTGWVGHVLAGQPVAARTALRVAAALGVQVDRDEWASGCAAAGVVLPDGLGEALLAANLFEARDDGLAFVHGMLRESVEREATEAGAWATVNRACADMLRSHGASGRVGRHLVAAGDLAGSLQPLLDGVTAALRTTDFAAAADLLAARENALMALDIPTSDIRLGEQWMADLRLRLGVGDLGEAERLAARVSEAARKWRWPKLQANAVCCRAMVAEKRADLSVAEAMYDQAELLAVAAADDEVVAACAEHRGTILRLRGDRDGSLAQLDRARALYEKLGDDRRIADVLTEIGGTRVTLGDVDGAEAPLRTAVSLYERLGNRYGRAGALNNLGEVLRKRGDYDGAEAAYHGAWEVLDSLGSASRVIPLLNLGLVRLALGRAPDARSTLEKGLELAQRVSRRVAEVYFRAGLLVLAADAEDGPAFDRHARHLAALLDETGVSDPEIASLALRAATACEARGDLLRARSARRIGESQVKPGA